MIEKGAILEWVTTWMVEEREGRRMSQTLSMQTTDLRSRPIGYWIVKPRRNKEIRDGDIDPPPGKKLALYFLLLANRRWTSSRRRRRGNGAMGWQIIFRGAKTLSEPADPGWHLNIQGSGIRIRRDRDITATIFIKLPRIRAPIYFRPAQFAEAANKIKWYVQCCSRYCPAVVIPMRRVCVVLWVCGCLWNVRSIFLTWLADTRILHSRYLIAYQSQRWKVI